jgi:4-hydroxymandelate oxidase
VGPDDRLTLEDYESAARAALPAEVYDFVAGGGGDEWTLAENRRAFTRWRLRPRQLRGASDPDLSSSLLGAQLAFPVLVAPWAYQRLLHPEGELATARAAAAEGTVMVVSMSASELLEDIGRVAAAPRWWQLYIYEDRAFTADVLARAVAAGYGAVCWTIDLPVFGLRHRDERNGFQVPSRLDPADFGYDRALTWDDLAWVREHTSGLPVLVKGILTAEDAEVAVQAGADAIVVSNHGGRQLDFAPASLTALPEVVAQVAGRVPVLMDGGVRTGVDVVKALALGAAAVLVGKSVAWGLAAGGEAGVAGVLRILREGVANTMALTGCRSLPEIGHALVAPA